MIYRHIPDNLQALNHQLSQWTAQEIVSWAVQKFGNSLTLASSFGAEDVVLIDILTEVTASPKIFFLDTGRLHQETYDLIDRIRSKYNIKIEAYFPETSAVQSLVQSKGANSFYASIEDRKQCCLVRKIEPLIRALTGVDAWITGLRRDQSVTRGDLAVIEIDEAHGGIIKINPLLDWNNDQVWEHIRHKNKACNCERPGQKQIKSE